MGEGMIKLPPSAPLEVDNLHPPFERGAGGTYLYIWVCVELDGIITLPTPVEGGSPFPTRRGGQPPPCFWGDTAIYRGGGGGGRGDPFPTLEGVIFINQISDSSWLMSHH